jgi:hypothetical protein
MAKTKTIQVDGREITILSLDENDYISLTDMASYRDNLEARIVVSNWMSTRYTVDFLAIWEPINNPNFNRMGFHTVRNREGRLILTPKRWVDVSSNMESINALFIGQGITQDQRLIQLNKTAITQMKSLLESSAMKKLK